MKILTLVLIACCSLTAYSQLDRKAIYGALSSDSKELVQKQLDELQKLKESSESKAFKGALTMKVAQFQKTPKEKLDLFNAGKKLLETEIKSNDVNVEYRFLRLLIQENAPKQLKYNGNITEDATSIISGYSKLKDSTKTALELYAKKSSSLSGLL
jgi:DNA-binding transcriptional regulator GbsR (MarR family)